MTIEERGGQGGLPPVETKPSRTREQNEQGMTDTGFKYFLTDAEKCNFLDFSGIRKQGAGGYGGYNKSGHGPKEYGVDFKAIQNPVTKEVYVGVGILETGDDGKSGSSTADFGRDFGPGKKVGHVITYPEGITPLEGLDKAESDIEEYFASIGLVKKE